MPPLPPLEPELTALEHAGRLRACPSIDASAGSSRIHGDHAGRAVTTFCSNDYLGLANHPALIKAATDAAQAYGTGAGASRLVSGEMALHRDLEIALAGFAGTTDALLFPTGYQANLAAVSSLAGPQDLIVSDEANHASLIDGCRLSKARIAVYRHADADAARAALAAGQGFRRRLLVTESLFSMDGDCAPLESLADLALTHDATLIVDEAHALGALGPGGRGLCRGAGIAPDVLVGTLGKSFGGFGGFVAGSPTLRTYLVNRARTFIYTTAPPPSVAAAALAAVQLVQGAEGEARRQRLARNMAHLHDALASVVATAGLTLVSRGPIYPIILGTDARAVAVSRRLHDSAFFVPPIRPPTVPEGTARLRVTASAEHTPSEIDGLARALAEALA